MIEEKDLKGENSLRGSKLIFKLGLWAIIIAQEQLENVKLLWWNLRVVLLYSFPKLNQRKERTWAFFLLDLNEINLNFVHQSYTAVLSIPGLFHYFAISFYSQLLKGGYWSTLIPSVLSENKLFDNKSNFYFADNESTVFPFHI